MLDGAGAWRKKILYQGVRAVKRDDFTGGTFHDHREYTGREVDFRTHLQNNRACRLDIDAGRWMSEDPLSFAGGDTNLYRYVGGSYANATDPSVLESVWPDVLRLVVAPGSYVAEFGYSWTSESARQYSLDGKLAKKLDRPAQSFLDIATANAGEMAEAGGRGLKVGAKANVNALAHTVVSTATVGFVEGSEAKKDAEGRVVRPFGWNVWDVTDEDLADGYMESYMFGRGGWELLAAAGTAGASTGLKGTGWAGRGARMLMRADTAKNVVMGSKGAADIYQNGLNWQNGLQTFGGFFGARGNLKMMNGAGMGGRANRLLNAADEFLINNRTTRALGSGAGLAIGAVPRGVDKLWKFATGETLIGSGLHKMFDGTRYQIAMQKTADWLWLEACFAAGTKLLAKGPRGEGWREIERITTDDRATSSVDFLIWPSE